MSQHDRYISPFSTRYSSDEMQYIFSDDNKFRTWRRLWVALARAEMKQGLTNITPEMVAELEAHVEDINLMWPSPAKAGAPRRDEPRLRLRPAVPQGHAASSIWVLPAATWATTPTSS